MVVAAAGPLTVVTGIMPLGVASGNGPAFPVVFALSTAILLVFAVGFCAMSRYVSDAGAFYTYVREGLGHRQGLAAAYLAVVTYASVQLATYGYIGAVIGDLVHRFGGPTAPWGLYALATTVVVGVLGYRRIELSGRVLAVLLILELFIILLFAFLVLGQHAVKGQAFSTAMFKPAAILSGSIGVALMFTITSFLGFEATAVFRDEARNPLKSIPRATYIAILLIGSVYTLSGWALVTQWGEGSSIAVASTNPGTIVLETIGGILGPIGVDIARILLITSLFAAILSFHNVLARYFFNLAPRNAALRPCRHIHPRHGSPHIATIFQTGTAVCLILLCMLARLEPVSQVFAWMAGTSTVGILALLALTSLSILVFFAKTRVDLRNWHTRIAPALALVSLIVCLYLTLINFSKLTGGSVVAAWIIGGSLVLGYVAGLLLASRQSGAVTRPGPRLDKPMFPETN
jgi:amino acid transporter